MTSEPLNAGQPPGWGQWPPAGQTPPPGNAWQLYGDDDLGPVNGERVGFGTRLGGHLLDNLLYGLLFALFAGPGVTLIFRAFEQCVQGPDDELICTSGAVEGTPLAGGIVLIALGLVLVGGLYVRALGRTGQTWGRRMVGVQVVDATTRKPLGVGRALGRSLFAWVVSGQFCSLGYLWMLWDTDKQTWHDKVVGSIVIRV